MSSSIGVGTQNIDSGLLIAVVEYLEEEYGRRVCVKESMDFLFRHHNILSSIISSGHVGKEEKEMISCALTAEAAARG